MVESREFGGTCALRGCDPKKVLVGAAEAVDHAGRMRGKGVKGDSGISWPELMAFKRTFTEPFPERALKNARAAGVVPIHALARFVSPRSVSAGAAVLHFSNCVIATGAKPADLGISGQGLAITSDDFLELETLPERIVFVGGGYIAFEFAHVAARAGASVTIAHRGARPLENLTRTSWSDWHRRRRA